MIRTAIVSIATFGLLAGCASHAATETTNMSAHEAASGQSSGGTAQASATTTTSTASASEQHLATVTIDELTTKLERHEVHVFDANSRERYERGHIPGATWVRSNNVEASALPTDHATPVVFYCGNEACMASHHAAQAAISLGYTNVAVLPAGIMGWEAAHKPVVAGPNPT